MTVLTALLFQVTLTGQVLADSTRLPVPGVEVVIEKPSRRTTTDSAGRFVLTGLPHGDRVILFRAIGWRPVRYSVRLIEGDTARVSPFMVKEPVTLAPITVTEAPKAPRGAGFEAFEERRRLGFGNFIDSTELKRRGSLKLEDVLRGFPAIRIMQPPECARRSMNCTTDPRMRVAVSGSQASLRGLDEHCFLQVVLNGMRVGRGGNIPWDQAFDLSNVRVDELKGVEIYKSAGEIPAEFNDTRAACGVLVLWLKP